MSGPRIDEMTLGQGSPSLMRIWRAGLSVGDEVGVIVGRSAYRSTLHVATGLAANPRFIARQSALSTDGIAGKRWEFDATGQDRDAERFTQMVPVTDLLYIQLLARGGA